MGATTLRKILVPTDFSAGSAAAFGTAISLAEAFEAEIVLLHVAEPEFDYTRYGLQESVIEARRAEQRAAIDERLGAVKARSGDFDRVSVEVRHGRARDCIRELAEEGGFDLIVIGTNGAAGLRQAFLGSTAERVVRSAPCSVLTVRGDD